MFNEHADPLRHLTNPATRTESILGQPFSNSAVGLDWLSPSHVINEFVKQAAGYDVFGEAANVFAGDWELVWQSAGAYRNLANALQDIGINVSSGNVSLDGFWNGNAADAAFQYFGGLSAAVSSQRIPLTELADAYEAAAEGTYRLAEALSGLMKDIFDSAMIGVAGAAAGTATIQTGVGFLTGWGIAAYEAHKIGVMTQRARALIAAASALIGGACGAIQAASATTGVLAQHPLPGEPYRHPGTAQP